MDYSLCEKHGMKHHLVRSKELLHEPMGPLKVWTIPEIQQITGACYDVGKHLPKGWTGTIEQIVDLPDYPLKDLLWICTHHLVCPWQIAHPYKSWSIKRALEICAQPDFKMPSGYPIDLHVHAGKAKVAYERFEKIWDQTDRKEQLTKFKELLSVAKGKT